MLFRFDRHPAVCRDRVSLLRSLNPGVPVLGLYGGAGGRRRRLFELSHNHLLQLDDFYAVRHEPRWSWKNGDLALKEWFRDVGSQLDFDVLHLIEWDLLLLDSLAATYASVPPTAVGLTALTPLAEVGDAWTWVRHPEQRDELDELRAWAARRWQQTAPLDACIGVGPCFPRGFLADYVAADPPELCHDELRWPLLAKAMGYSTVGTGLRRAWHDPAEDLVFGSTGVPVTATTISAELAKPDGRRAFHPVHIRTPAGLPGRSGHA